MKETDQEQTLMESLQEHEDKLCYVVGMLDKITVKLNGKGNDCNPEPLFDRTLCIENKLKILTYLLGTAYAQVTKINQIL